MFYIFCILLILILWIFFLINFPEKKLGKTTRNKENMLVLYYELHNLYQSLHFIILKRFKIAGLILRIYRRKHWRCSGKYVFLEITIAILPVKKFSFSKFAGLLCVTWLKMNYFTNFFKAFNHIFQNTYFSKNLSLAASGVPLHSLKTNYDFTVSVTHYPHLKTTSKLIPLNQQKFQMLNQNKEARR